MMLAVCVSGDFPEKMMALPHGRSSPVRPRLGRWLSVVRDFFYGMTAHELNTELRREKGYLNHLFMCVVFGDLVGLPLLPPYYAMRLLPYVIPTLQTWKRGLLREKDITDLASRDL
jgi:hypothetical protein